MAGVVVPIPTKVNGNCMIDAVLASKQEWEDVLWIGSVAYTRGQDVEVWHQLLAYAAGVRTCSTMCISCVLHHMQVRGALLDFIEKNAQTDFSRCVPMVARACGLRRLTFDDIIRRWKTEHSTSEYVKQARAVLPHGRYAALDTVMLVAMAIVDGCTYVVHSPHDKTNTVIAPRYSRGTTIIMFTDGRDGRDGHYEGCGLWDADHMVCSTDITLLGR